MSEVLVNVMRGGMVESRHRGDLAVVDTNGKIIFSVGDARTKTFWRSSAKPFQAVSLVEEGGLEHFGFSDRELAVIVSSHSGEKEHTDTVAGILKKIGLSPDHLECGPSSPVNAVATQDLLKSNLPFLPIHNNCSGKHSGMLAFCVLKGWPVKGYSNVDHPLQKHTLRVISGMTQVDMAEITIGIDGCGVPVFGLPVSSMAAAYARLAQPDKEAGEARDKALCRIRGAMVANPFYVAGTGRLDTALMEVTGGRLVAKAGAEAVYCVGLVGKGMGLCLKIEDGGSRAVGPVIVETMRYLGWLTDEEYIKLESWRRPLVKNCRGDTAGFLEMAYRF